MSKGNKQVGRALRALRERLGYNTTQAAYHANISASYLGLIECGQAPLSDAMLVRLVRSWGVSFEDIAKVQDAGKPKSKSAA
jgi:transcriptional regulator with XRE-family HTH domain